MKLGARIFLAYVLLTALCFSYPLSRFFGELRTLFVENVEEVLVNQAHILATLVGDSMEAGRFQSENLYKNMPKSENQNIFKAGIDYFKG